MNNVRTGDVVNVYGVIWSAGGDDYVSVDGVRMKVYALFEETDDPFILVQDKDLNVFFAHHKQCRRLKLKRQMGIAA